MTTMVHQMTEGHGRNLGFIMMIGENTDTTDLHVNKVYVFKMNLASLYPLFSLRLSIHGRSRPDSCITDAEAGIV